MKLAHKVELRSTKRQKETLRQHAGASRWAYNWGLSRCKAAYQEWLLLDKPKKWDGWPNAYSLHRELNLLKKQPKETGGVPWMYDVSKCAPHEALRDLEVAFKGFLKGRSRYPRFKSKKLKIGGFRLSGSITVTECFVKLPRIGKVRLMPNERGYLSIGKPAQITVSEQNDRWFVSVICPDDAMTISSNGLSAVGLDMGVSRLATLSDGTVIENPKALAKSQRKLKKLQRSLARKTKGSRNRLKVKVLLAKTHSQVCSLRKDHLHKASTQLTKSHGLIVLEDLKIKNMTKGGGSHKRGLNRVMLDASLGEFRRLLEYKGVLYGCKILSVNPAYTSQRCSSCGHTEKANRQNQAQFSCQSCGFEINADLNASINILVAASLPETLNACGGVVRPDQFRLVRQISMKQELSNGNFLFFKGAM